MLRAESETDHLAQVKSDESNDCSDNLCSACACDPCKCREEEPDAHLDAAYEERTELHDEAQGWPGDGSGTDDLADLMAHGDEGCCDGPND